MTENWQADHVYVGRPLKQLPITVWESLLIPMYVPLCNVSSNKINMNGSRTYANPDKYDGDTNATKERCFGRQL